MKTYVFEFNVVPTDNSWWSSYRNERVKVCAENLQTAKEMFIEQLSEKYCLDVSKTAAKTPKKMYADTKDGAKQTGLVFKASTEVQFNYSWRKKYADIWTTINELVPVF